VIELYFKCSLSVGSQAAHQSGEDEISLSTQGRTYTVDFHSMQQINEDTGTTRPVQRRLNPSSLSSNMVDISANASSGTVSNASVNDNGLLSTGIICQYIYIAVQKLSNLCL
jgi:E3 ubiquitin-protein ligase TRIP12